MSDFRDRAACRDADPELFFPVGESGPALRQIAAAKAVCLRCLVTDECLAWALDARHEEGVWGGLDAGQRRVLRRRTHHVGDRRKA
jgi:WhiB family redox-sensing transcriptional regulator